MTKNKTALELMAEKIRTFVSCPFVDEEITFKCLAGPGCDVKKVCIDCIIKQYQSKAKE